MAPVLDGAELFALDPRDLALERGLRLGSAIGGITERGGLGLPLRGALERGQRAGVGLDQRVALPVAVDPLQAPRVLEGLGDRDAVGLLRRVTGTLRTGERREGEGDQQGDSEPRPGSLRKMPSGTRMLAATLTGSGRSSCRNSLASTLADRSASIDSMAQLIVRNLEDDVRDRIRALAAMHDRSMEEEVREILRTAALRPQKEPAVGLGTRFLDRFRGCGLRKGEVEELRGHRPQAAEFGS